MKIYNVLKNINNKLKNINNKIESRDYIVEEGISGNWYYRKWASGVAECWFTAPIQRTINVTGKWSTSTLYYSTLYQTYYDYPSGLFIQAPIVTALVDATPMSVWLMPVATDGYQGTKDHTPYYHYVRVDSVTNVKVYDMFEAKGFWKTYTPIS